MPITSKRSTDKDSGGGVTVMRAKQMMKNNNKYTERPKQQFTAHYDCKMNENDKRKFTPRLLEK